ncbi:MAG: TIM barrel protein [Pseudomonadota bacterium]
MPKFSANLSTLFGELGFLDRFEAAAKAGFGGVECLFPYAYPVEQIAHRLCSHGLQLVQYSLPCGDWAGGERGIACDPERRAEFRRGIDEAIRYARALGVRQLHCLAGILPVGVTPEQGRATLISNLQGASALLKQHGIALLISPQDSSGYPGFFVTGAGQALDIIRDTGSNNLFLQCGIEYLHCMEGEQAGAVAARLALLRHVDVTDCANGRADDDHAPLLGMLDRLGYPGWIGCAREPGAFPLGSLVWRIPHLTS